jgi:hypothetical protein
VINERELTTWGRDRNIRIIALLLLLANIIGSAA